MVRIINLVVLALLFLVMGCASKNDHKGNQQIMVIQEKAEIAYKAARLDQAESLYLQVLQSVPNYAPAWFRLGNIYTRTGRHDAAISAYSRSISLNPEDQKAHYNISLVRLKQATGVLDAALAQPSTSPPVTNQIKALRDTLNTLQSNTYKPGQVN